MTKEENKQWLRSQIDSSIKTQHDFNDNIFYLYYNKQYLRALKLSKITDKPVNKKDFKGGEKLFSFYKNSKYIWNYSKIRIYLKDNYSISLYERNKLMKEVFEEYDEYKGYEGYEYD